MKKRLFLISLLALLLLVGCDGSGWQKTIPAQAYPSMNVLELKVGARQNGGEYAAYGGTKFQSELSPWEMVRPAEVRTLPQRWSRAAENRRATC